MTLWEKAKALFGSIRFWIVTLTFATKWLSGVETDGFVLGVLLENVYQWLAVVAGIGTLDSVAERFGATFGRKK